ncbi:hypothetical protein HS960_12975 [Sphingobacterium paramultivorum]|uniref:Uncharacterized protein n=1 Tax=Sphingobacterium paramultivorum TaxID=2886510 RepID=A0A7G5E3D2_9SPHI|nr:hypothetical protein [Sphingobacterium paramultivorum]QMV68507.1 hypothetical protein HS960_12975 [Sphingobacterium paramultivorum]WSO17448.1 hypothetical protein VUL84_12965 [Sphingobacterium paramultivorum]
MGTKEEIFNKIGDLLQDLNGQYLSLSEQGSLSEINELVTLEAKAQAVAAYITLLKTKAVLQEGQSQHALSTAALDSKKIAFNDYFTPPSTIRTSAQQVVAEQPQKEVQDAQPVEDFSRGNEESILVNEETIVAEKEVPFVSESEPAKSEEPSPEIVEPVIPPVAAIPSVFAAAPVEELAYQAEKDVTEQVEEPTVFVTEVIEEPKEVVIEQPQEVFIQEEINTVIEEAPARPLTLNEIISQQKQAGVQNRVYQVNQSGHTDKLTDIKAGISLNDKLLFIKDLFNGYSLAYSEAVELLNRFTSYAEADAFLQTNYAIKNKWADKPHTVEKLYDVLRRRYN